MQSSFSSFLKMSLYVFVSTIITFCSLVDTIDAHYFDSVSTLDWIKIGLKSLIPGMISLKAYLDDSLHVPNTTEKPEIKIEEKKPAQQILTESNK